MEINEERLKILETVYLQIKSLCRTYNGRTNTNAKALAKMTGLTQQDCKWAVKSLLDIGMLDQHLDKNHFPPPQISMGWDGSEPHSPVTRYLTIVKL